MSAYKSTINAAADSEAQTLAGTTGTAVARDEGLAQSASGANAVTANDSLVLGGSGNRNNLGGEFVASEGSTINITNPDTQSAEVAKTFAETVEKIVSERAAETAEAIELDDEDGGADGGKKSGAFLVVIGFVVLVIGGAWVAMKRKK
jgi:hypothetical protein